MQDGSHASMSPKDTAYAILERFVTQGNSAAHLRDKLKRNFPKQNMIKFGKMVETCVQQEKDIWVHDLGGPAPHESAERRTGRNVC